VCCRAESRTSTLSVSQHVTDVVLSCAQTKYDLHTLRALGIVNTTLRVVYRSVIVAKLLDAAGQRLVRFQRGR